MTTTATAPTSLTSTSSADALSRVLKLTAHGLAKGPGRYHPIHRGVELTMRGDTDTLTLTTFNGTTSVQACLPLNLPAHDEAKPGAAATMSVVVDHAHLSAALKGLPRSAYVTLCLTEHGVTITTPAGTFILLRIGDGTFPSLPTPADEPTAPLGVQLFTATAADLAAGVKATSRAASTADNVATLRGLGVLVSDGQPVTISATDRYRWTSWDTGQVWNGPALHRSRVILPARPVAALAAALPRYVGADTPVTLTIDPTEAATGTGWATLTTGNGTVRATFALIVGEYPKVEVLWPEQAQHTIRVSASALTAAVRQTAAMQEPRHIIALHLGDDDVTVTTEPGVPAEVVAHQEVRVPAPGNSMNLNAPIGFNPGYLTDALTAFPDTVTISGTARNGGWTITDDGPVRTLLMSVKLPEPN